MVPPPASANLPPRPAGSTATGVMPAQVPPAGRHPEDDFPDRDMKRFKSDPTPMSAFTGSSSNAVPMMGSSWITLEIQFVEADEIKPEWNRDRLSAVTVENLVNGSMISTVKDKIFAATGFPVGKQKLILGDGTVTKNQTTLGEYGFRIGQRGELRLAVKKQ